MGAEDGARNSETEIGLCFQAEESPLPRPMSQGKNKVVTKLPRKGAWPEGRTNWARSGLAWPKGLKPETRPPRDSTIPCLGPCRAETQGCTIILNVPFLNFYEIEINWPCDHPVYSPGDTFLEEWKERRKTGWEGRRQGGGKSSQRDSYSLGFRATFLHAHSVPRGATPYCPGLVSPVLALDLPACAWSPSRDTSDFAFGPHLCGEDETHLPPRNPTPQR